MTTEFIVVKEEKKCKKFYFFGNFLNILCTIYSIISGWGCKYDSFRSPFAVACHTTLFSFISIILTIRDPCSKASTFILPPYTAGLLLLLKVYILASLSKAGINTSGLYT